MSSQPDISIIIPAYNLESYIGATLESTLLQKDVSLEVLVVDDGSTDSTRSIVQNYAQKYPFIQLLSNEKTKGVSGARNTALQHMRGKTCFFLDGDDILPPNALAPLVACMQENDAQLVRGLISALCYQRWLYVPFNLQAHKDPKRYPYGGFTQYLYNADFIKKHQCSFPDSCTRGEDCVFFCQVYCQEPKIAYVHSPVYLYRINHKRFIPTTEHALFFIKHFQKIKDILHTQQKEYLYPSYLQSHFYNKWLVYAYAPLQENSESAKSFIKECCHVLSNVDEKNLSFLQVDLKQHTENFIQACKNQDIESMHALLMQEGILKKPVDYMGIEEHCHKKYWPLLRILHRVKNILTVPRGFKNFFYVYTLEQRAKKHLQF